MLKFVPKTRQNACIVYTNMVNSMRSTYAYNTSNRGTDCSWATETEHGNEEVIYQFLLKLPTMPSKIRQAICSTTHKICTGTDKPIGAKSEDYFVLKVQKHALATSPNALFFGLLHKLSCVRLQEKHIFLFKLVAQGTTLPTRNNETHH